MKISDQKMENQTDLTSNNFPSSNDSLNIQNELCPHPINWGLITNITYSTLLLITVILVIILLKKELYQYFCGGPQVHFVDSNREHFGWSNR